MTRTIYHCWIRTCLILSMLITARLHPATWFVFYTGQGGSGRSWDQAVPSLEQVIGQASPADTILVGYSPASASIYVLETGLVLDKPLKIRSARYNQDMDYEAAVSDSSLCIMDAGEQCRPLLIIQRHDSLAIHALNTEVRGFTFRHGDASGEPDHPGFGGGLCISGKASPTVRNCRFESNMANRNPAGYAGYGGGICCTGDSSAAVIQYCVIQNNTASQWTEGYGGGAAIIDGASAQFTNNRVLNNRGTLSETVPGGGGGVYCSGLWGRPFLFGNTIRGNQAALNTDGWGGGLFLTGGIMATVQNCVVDSNLATLAGGSRSGWGGGICINGDSTAVTVQFCLITSNQAAQNCRGYGGGVAFTGGTAGSLHRNQIRLNTATSAQSGAGEGGGLICHGQGTSPSVSINIFLKNTASQRTDGYGGAIAVTGSAAPSIESCTIDSNIASAASPVLPGLGGGICCTGDSTAAEIFNNSLRWNTASMEAEGWGGGIALLSGAGGTVSMNDIEGNIASHAANRRGAAGGICCRDRGTTPQIRLNTLSDNTGSVAADGDGGGIGIFNGASPEILQNTFNRNTASLYYTGRGGGICCSQTEFAVVMSDNVFDQNTGSGTDMGFGGGIYYGEGSKAACTENRFINNRGCKSVMESGLGGAVCFENQTAEPVQVICSGNLFENNTANKNGHGRGGALACTGDGLFHLNIRNNIIKGNLGSSAPDAYGLGGACYIAGQSHRSVIRNNTLIGNGEDKTDHGEGHGSGLFLNTVLPDTSIRNNLFVSQGDTAGSDGVCIYSAVPCTVTHNGYYSYVRKTSDLVDSRFETDADPLLDPATLVPLMRSPCIDAGMDPVHALTEYQSGWFLDIGAFEFRGTSIEREILPGASVLFAGNVRAKLLDSRFTDTLTVSMQVHQKSRHPLAYYSLAHWYKIGCGSDLEGSGSLILSYSDDDCAGFDEHTLRLWRFNARENRWQGPLFTQRDTVDNWIQAPFEELAGDWIITDAADMNALAVMVWDLQAEICGSGIRIGWNISPSADMLSLSVWRSCEQQEFSELHGSGIPVASGSIETALSYTDTSVMDGKRYTYKIGILLKNGQMIYSEPVSLMMRLLPSALHLFPNYPNPFNQKTRIRFLLPSDEHVRVHIINMRGTVMRRIDLQTLGAGEHDVSWDGCGENHVPAESGVYIIKVNTTHESRTGKMILCR
ncbi:T9SS type A sorting domain-containing protein [bacterium]|nr:T9SS type A sorting domain-containing protein [bacterium]